MPLLTPRYAKPSLHLAFSAPLLLAAAALAPPAPCPADDGLVPIFNGKDLTGWVVDGASSSNSSKGEKAEPVWSVRDGILRCTGQRFGFLRYDKKVADFVFEVEYRMSPRANSGIGIRGTRFTGPAKTRPSFASYEVQLLDDAGKPATKGSTGSLYRYVAPKENASKPAGQWNHIRIECRGPRIRVTLNGKTVQDIDQTTVPEIKDKPLSGYIMLQSHTRPVEFRNPRLLVLKP
jgi:hypothetical protein